VTGNDPTPREDGPVEPTLVTAGLLLAFGLPATAAAAAFAFGSLEDIGRGSLVALGVWAVGIGVAFLQPLRTAPSAEVVPPALRWGLVALAVAAVSAVVASSAPVLPWSLVLVVGPAFAWITGSLWVIGREGRSG
jgi:hypothetical protein